MPSTQEVFQKIYNAWGKLQIFDSHFLPDQGQTTKKQILLAGDRFSKQEIVQIIQANNLPWKIISEIAPNDPREGVVYDPQNATHTLYVDPVDGSLNLSLRIESRLKNNPIDGILPVGILLALAENTEQKTIQYAGMMVQLSERMRTVFYDGEKTIVFDEHGDEILPKENGDKAIPTVGVSRNTRAEIMKDDELTKKITPIAPGSLAGVMLMLLENSVDVLALSEVDFEEVGVIIAFMKGVGNVVKDADGHDVSDKNVVPGKKHEIYVGPAENVTRILAVQELRQRLRA